jgi:hypothetical protein
MWAVLITMLLGNIAPKKSSLKLRSQLLVLMLLPV